MDKLAHIGARIKLFRKHQNLTLEELAYMVHKSPSTICKYENGRINIDILTLSEIANAMEIEISQLTDFPAERTKPAVRNTANFFRRHNRFHVYNLIPVFSAAVLSWRLISFPVSPFQPCSS